MAQRHQFVVHLGAYAVAAYEGVYLEREVECGASCRHGLDFALRCEHEYLRCEEVQLHGVEEVHGVGLRVVEYLLDGAQPVVQFVLVLGQFAAVLVLPVCGESLFGHLVHLFGAYLHLYPLSLFRHEGLVQRLVAVCLGVAQPVAHAGGVVSVQFVDGHIYLEAVVYLLLLAAGCEDDAHGQYVVYLLEGHVLVLHLGPDRVGGFHPRLYLIVQSQLVDGLAYGGGEVVEEFFAFFLGVGYFLFYRGILLGVLVSEAQVLEFVFYLVQSQSVCQGGIDVERLAGYLVLLVGRL